MCHLPPQLLHQQARLAPASAKGPMVFPTKGFTVFAYVCPISQWQAANYIFSSSGRKSLQTSRSGNNWVRLFCGACAMPNLQWVHPTNQPSKVDVRYGRRGRYFVTKRCKRGCLQDAFHLFQCAKEGWCPPTT